ncbi:HNH endonuclease [Conexibacter sp. SYSU D00693]|uniref:HNH endonuclease n=1 Tax=Conexibacter sp. SYSU D00693 TaxID=2812560 RepID=UPI00196B2F15|nr:HNH endonuclease [Conexibacter sp. SYSU D00693]
MPRPLSYTEAQAREAIAASRSLTEALRRLGVCQSGGSIPVLRKYVELWGIPTDHLDPRGAALEGLRRSRATPRPLEELLVAGSLVARGTLKRRLYAEGLKEPRCELCGQGEHWRGRRMSLILDHINGVSNDNRLENLQIVCPNCAATLDTHCGRNSSAMVPERECLRCGSTFRPNRRAQRYCSRACGMRYDRAEKPRPGARKVERPPTDQLLREVDELGFSAVGRRYGVSDNAIRKWLRTAGVEPPRRPRGPVPASGDGGSEMPSAGRPVEREAA